MPYLPCMAVDDAVEPGDAGPPRPRFERPGWLVHAEARVAAALRIGPAALSGIKLLVVTPLLALSFAQGGVLPATDVSMALLLLAFFALDYLDGAAARTRGGAVAAARGTLDRITDVPLLALAAYHCLDRLPLELLAAKVVADLALILLVLGGRISAGERLRTTLGHTTLAVLVFLSQGWVRGVVTADLAAMLLLLNVLFAALLVLRSLRVLQKRFIADALSASNLLCGIFSMIAASRGRVDLSLLFLMVGSGLDGADGAAARRWGGTRFGVFSDDIADGVNYGLAPGYALAVTLGGAEGWTLGILYAVFTVARLVFFTLNKEGSDPSYFAGVPSTNGGIVSLCALILFPEQPALVGLLVGVACAQMVSFDTAYRHLGRAVGRRPGVLLWMTPGLFLLVAGGLVWGVRVPVAILLGATLVYGLLPVGLHFARVRSST